MSRLGRIATGLVGLIWASIGAVAAEPPRRAPAHLTTAYPDHIRALDGNVLIWADGSRMAFSDGKTRSQAEALLEGPDVASMLYWPYPARTPLTAPAVGVDPGRPRHKPFFDKMYGDCRKGETEQHLVDVVWLPAKAGQRLRVTRINGVASRVEAVSRDLDRLPAGFDRFLVPAAGAYNCRTVAGTERPSPHGYGIAIDIAVRPAHYWRWDRVGSDGKKGWRNSIPPEIVAVFERHGFIWGGRWHHYDTMHFEYRPELIEAAAEEMP
jgi:hypothetical protein